MTPSRLTEIRTRDAAGWITITVAEQDRRALLAYVDTLATAAQALCDELPASCDCIEAYRDRELIDPQCRYHEVSPEVDELRALLGEVAS